MRERRSWKRRRRRRRWESFIRGEYSGQTLAESSNRPRCDIKWQNRQVELCEHSSVEARAEFLMRNMSVKAKRSLLRPCSALQRSWLRTVSVEVNVIDVQIPWNEWKQTVQIYKIGSANNPVRISRCASHQDFFFFFFQFWLRLPACKGRLMLRCPALWHMDRVRRHAA